MGKESEILIMKKRFIVQTEFKHDDNSISNLLWGPFPNEHVANSTMQAMFDNKVQELEDEDAVFEKDDTDAGHFRIDGDDAQIHWTIEEPNDPSGE